MGAKQRRTSLQRDDEHEAAAAIFCLLCCTLFVWCVCVCVCVCVCLCMYQRVLVIKTNATVASAISQYPRSNNDSGYRSAKTDVVGLAAANHEQTNGRTQASERGRRSCCGAFVLRTNARAVARPRRCGACVLQPTNKCAGARNRRCCDGFCPTVSDVSHVESVRRLPSVSQSENPSSCLTAVCLLGRSCVYWVECMCSEQCTKDYLPICQRVNVQITNLRPLN